MQIHGVPALDARPRLRIIVCAMQEIGKDWGSASDSYVCPTCGVAQNRNSKRRVSRQDCCLECADFLRAVQTPIDVWVHQIAVPGATEAIGQHPEINGDLMAEVIRETGSEGQYSAQDVVRVLSLMRDNLDQRLKRAIAHWNRRFLVPKVFRALDQVYGENMVLLEEGGSLGLREARDVEKDLIRNQTVGKYGKALERILELALASEDSPKRTRRESGRLADVIEPAMAMAVTNQTIESHLYLWNRGSLSVRSRGWSFDLPAADMAKLERMAWHRSVDDIQQRSTPSDSAPTTDPFGDLTDFYMELNKPTRDASRTSLDYDAEDYILRINDIHRSHFGHSYCERLLGLLFIAKLMGDTRRDWATEEVVVDYVREQLSATRDVAVSVVSSLRLDGVDIRSENNHPFGFRRKYCLLRRPLPAIKIGNRVFCLLSPSIMQRSFLHTRVEYTDGSHPELIGTPLEPVIDRVNREYGEFFVTDRISKALSENGFTVKPHVKRIAKHNLEIECGEIDILALDGGQRHLVVGECKHRIKKDVTPRQSSREIGYYTEPDTGFSVRLRRKLVWVENNLGEVLEYIGSSLLPREVKCIPAFFINYWTPASEFVDGIEFVREKDLAAWCKKSDRV